MRCLVPSDYQINPVRDRATAKKRDAYSLIINSKQPSLIAKKDQTSLMNYNFTERNNSIEFDLTSSIMSRNSIENKNFEHDAIKRILDK